MSYPSNTPGFMPESTTSGGTYPAPSHPSLQAPDGVSIYDRLVNSREMLSLCHALFDNWEGHPVEATAPIPSTGPLSIQGVAVSIENELMALRARIEGARERIGGHLS